MAEPTPPLETFTLPIAAGAAIFAFTTAPVFRFAASASLAQAGAGVGVCGALFVMLSIIEPRSWWTRLMGSIAAISVAWLILIFSVAAADAEKHDVLCGRIQRAMMHPTPRTRTDLPDVFQALGCRPQPM